HRVDSLPVLALVLAHEDVDRLAARVDALRVLGVDRDAANLPRAAAAVARLAPRLAGVLADPHAVAAGAGDDLVRLARDVRDRRHRPGLEPLAFGLPRVAVAALQRDDALVGPDVHSGFHVAPPQMWLPTSEEDIEGAPNVSKSVRRRTMGAYGGRGSARSG